MGFIGNQKTYVPYINTKDYSKGISVPSIEFHGDDSSPNFFLLVIAIIGILVSAFLLVSYYVIISKYCGNPESTRRRENPDTDFGEVLEDDHNPSAHFPWQISTTGLDEALIKSITGCKYKKADGLIEGTDCSVCLSEFKEDESLRLLPKCSHAFHVHCIDTWLRSHSNCPLCRANIIFFSALPLPFPTPVTENPPPGNESSQDRQPVTNENVTAAVQESRRRSLQELKRVQSDLGNVQGRDTVIEIREEDYQQMRRSVSMDHFCETQVPVADILRMNQGEDSKVEECHFSSKQSAEASKVRNKMRVLKYCVMNPVAMKTSFPSGRFFLTGQGRVRDPTIPL